MSSSETLDDPGKAKVGDLSTWKPSAWPEVEPSPFELSCSGSRKTESSE